MLYTDPTWKMYMIHKTKIWFRWDDQPGHEKNDSDEPNTPKTDLQLQHTYTTSDKTDACLSNESGLHLLSRLFLQWIKTNRERVTISFVKLQTLAYITERHVCAYAIVQASDNCCQMFFIFKS